MNADSQFSAILLAAGESRRMGADNKLLLPLDGEPMVRRTARQLLAARLGEVVAVLGHDADSIAAALAGLPLRTVRNPDYRDGQMTSVHAGLAALKDETTAVMICLADQPFLTAGDYDNLLDGFAARGSKSILVPTYEGRRGNPIVLAPEHRPAILGRQANLGCKHLIERNPDLVMTLAVDSDRFIRDIDTESDYRATTG